MLGSLLCWLPLSQLLGYNMTCTAYNCHSSEGGSTSAVKEFHKVIHNNLTQKIYQEGKNTGWWLPLLG